MSLAISIINVPDKTQNQKDWLKDNISVIYQQVHVDGVAIFRGLSVANVDAFFELISHVDKDLIDYSEDSTPRTLKRDKVYTSTEFASEQVIPLHNEMSYCHSWPRYLWFWVKKTADKGGQTTLADSRKIYQSLPEQLREKFTKKGVEYVRTYYDFMGVPWRTAFKTDDKEQVTQLLKSTECEFEWITEDVLQTRQKVEGTVIHPISGERCWFNQAFLFHPYSLNQEHRLALTSAFNEEQFPRYVKFADGELLVDEELAQIQSAMEENIIIPDWQDGDIALIDNLLFSHGRCSFQGKREVYVAMSTKMTSTFQSSENLKAAAHGTTIV
ncbi:TauD/TfdA family dioxygenase [Vibrio cholerae]|nr:TauD/TfdA family dioxygenase [Vibrio cholerae]